LEILSSEQGENPARFSSKSVKMATLLTAILCLLLRNYKKKQTRISGHRQPSIENLYLLLAANLAQYRLLRLKNILYAI